MTTSDYLRDYHPEVVVVDEAGQVPLAVGAGLAAIGAALLFLGDQEQLAPIFPEQVREDSLACSVLDWLVRHRPYDRLVETHRLNAELADVIGSVFYPNASGGSSLKPSAEASGRLLNVNVTTTAEWVRQSLSSTRSLVWVHTGELAAFQESLVESDIVATLIDACLSGGVDVGNIAVLTPFRKQVNRIRAAVRQRIGETIPMIDTVESMQGQSVEIAIISLAASDPAYLSTIGDFYYRSNRWCVASSRATTKTIVVGSPAVLKARPDSIGGLDGLMKLRALLRSAAEVVYYDREQL